MNVRFSINVMYVNNCVDRCQRGDIFYNINLKLSTIVCPYLLQHYLELYYAHNIFVYAYVYRTEKNS